MRVGFEVTTGLDGKTRFDLFLPPNSSNDDDYLVTFASAPKLGIAVVLMGRLFYRHELCSRLSNAYLYDFSSDAALVLAVFQQLGDRGLSLLEGEYAIVLFDRSQQQIFAARDPLGAWPLYWTTEGSKLRVNTSLLKLARKIQDRKLNLDFLATFLMFPYAFVELHSEQTAFHQANRIMPGTIWSLSLQRQAKKVWDWDWKSQTSTVSEITLEEAGSQFAHVFNQAVKQRIERGASAFHLSGGMDSSSVVCIAREQSLSSGVLEQIATLSLVYKLPSLASEKEYIQMIIAKGEAFAPYYLDGDSALDFQWFTKSIPDHDEPYAGLFRLPMERLLVEAAHQIEATTILTGVGVEELLDGNRLHIADLLWQGRWLEALQEAQQWAYAGNTSLWSVLRRYGIEPILFYHPYYNISALFQHSFSQWSNLQLFNVPPWITPEFARTYQMRHKGLQIARQAYSPPIEETANIWAIQTSAGNWSSWYLAGPLGIQTSHPFLDPRLITLCLALPMKVRQIPGVKKPILQAAMRGILPEAILNRRFKRSFNDVYWLGLSQNLLSLEDMVRNSHIDDLGLFNKEQLLQAMRQHAIGIGGVMAGGRINSSLALIAWYEQIQNFFKNRKLESEDVHQITI